MTTSAIMAHSDGRRPSDWRVDIAFHIVMMCAVNKVRTPLGNNTITPSSRPPVHALISIVWTIVLQDVLILPACENYNSALDLCSPSSCINQCTG